MNEIKKWLNELFAHYEALKRLGKLTPHDKNCWDVYDSVSKKIAEIEASENLDIRMDNLYKQTL